MNKKTLILAGLIICLVIAGIAAITVSNRSGDDYDAGDEDIEMTEDEVETEEEGEDVMTEEQTIEDLTEEPEEPDITDLSEMDVEEENLPSTLEEALPALVEAGYSKTAEGYKATDNVDGVRSVRIITAKDNTVTADLSYDYGSGNQEMIKFYKEDPDKAVSTMLAAYIVVLADRSTARDGKLEYTISVGGKKVKSGTMSLKQAREYQESAAED